MSRNTADCVAFIGSTGTGKGTAIKQRVAELLAARAGRRLVVWSPLEETDRYGRAFKARVVRNVRELIAALQRGELRVVLMPAEDEKIFRGQFDLFCKIAWKLGDAVVVVDELSTVTTPSYAPRAWKKLSTAGRHHGLTVIGASQRPAQIDKDFLGNCTEIRGYRVNYDEDQKALARVMGESPETFRSLLDLHYVHRYIRELRNVRGVQALPGGLARPAQKNIPASPVAAPGR